MKILLLILVLVKICSAKTVFESLKKEALGNFKWQQSLRRWLHQHPELGFAEQKTSQRIQEELTALGVKFTTNWGKRLDAEGKEIGGTGVVAELGTGQSPCVGLRADIDALPITEQTEIDYRSLHDGVMHACGHDAHTAMLLGAIRILKSYETTLKGTVRFVFQPAEEGGGGAECLVNEGVLTQHPPVDSMFGLHVLHILPTGMVASRPGRLLSAAESFTIRVEGRSYYANVPYLAKDPVTVASLIIQSIQHIVSREVSPTQHEHAGLISVTAVESPQSFDLIPPYAELKGTIRALDMDKMTFLKKRLMAVAENIAISFEQTATVVFGANPYPPTVNDPNLFEWTSKTLKPDFNIADMPPVMAAEDFAFYGLKVPSNFLFLGIGSGSSPLTNITLHSDHFAVDEAVLPIGSALLARLAIARIETLKAEGGKIEL